MRIIVESLPISVNAMYARGRGGRRYKTPTFVEWETTTTMAITRDHPELVTKKREWGYPVFMVYEFVIPEDKFYLKSGGVRRIDVSNFLKSIEDVVTPLLGIDDSLVRGISLLKSPGKTARTIIEVFDEQDPELLSMWWAIYRRSNE